MVQLTTFVGALALAQSAVAFPSISQELWDRAGKANPKIKRAGFDASLQYVSNQGANAFVAPGNGDLRGPCPGLNAMANHGYIPHNGVATIQQFITGTYKVFGMGTDLATFLATYGAVIDGDLTSWSIGGTPSGSLIQGRGISNSHNKYESDASPTRGDLYEYGNDYLVQLDQFKDLYGRQSSVSDADANYDLPLLTQFRADRLAASKANNPYFFNGPFTGVAVQPAAYTFIYRFMGNKSAQYPEGRLDKTVLKSFFSITGADNALQYTPGNEKIPDNWYKRAIGDEYTIPFFLTDLIAAANQHPEFLEIGGNTGKVNSFAGVEPTDISNGVYNTQALTNSNQALCFAVQAALQLAPDFAAGITGALTAAVNQIASSATGATNGCPAIGTFNFTSFNQFPGFTKLNANGGY